jgi:hypothetical protein
LSLPHLSLLVNAGVLATFWIALAFLTPRIFRRFRDVSPWTWLALGVLLAVQATVIKPLIPHTVFFSNNHGIDVAAIYRDTRVFVDVQTFAEVYGNTFWATLGWVQLLPRPPTLYDVNFAMSQVSLVAVFLLVLSLFRSQSLSLLSALMLAWLPVRLRISVSESMFISAELYLVLALLLLVLFLQTEDFAYLVLDLVAIYLLVEARVEFMLLGPLVIVALLVATRPRKLGLIFRTPLTWVTLAVLAALFVPRALVVLGAMGRNQMYTMVPTYMFHFDHGWLGPFNVFFARAYTPLVYIALFAVGTVAMAFANRRMLGFLTFSWVAMTFVFSKYYFTVSCYIRRTIPVQFLLVILAAFGAWFLLRLTAGRPRLRAAAATGLVALLAVSVLGHRDFLGRLYTMQQEHAFLERVRAVLPPDAPVVYRADEDDAYIPHALNRETLLSRWYQGRFLQRDSGADQVLSIRRFEAEADRRIREGAFAYLGAPCYKLQGIDRSRPRAPRRGPDVPDYVDPACARLREAYVLQPVLEQPINGPSLGFEYERIQGSNRPIGLYRILGRKDGP